MSQTPVTVTYSLEEILGQINDKLNNLQQTNNNINERIARVETEIQGMKVDLKDLKGSQKAQIWTLIGILGTAVVGTVIRFIITASPGGNP